MKRYNVFVDWMTFSPNLFMSFAVQLLSHVWLFTTPWTEAGQASLSFTISWSLLKLMSIELTMPSYCRPLSSPSLALNLSPASGFFPVSWLFPSGGQSIGASASASVLPINIQGWFPLGLTGLIPMLSKGLSMSLLQHHRWKASVSTQPSLRSNSHICTWLLEKL